MCTFVCVCIGGGVKRCKGHPKEIEKKGNHRQNTGDLFLVNLMFFQ